MFRSRRSGGGPTTASVGRDATPSMDPKRTSPFKIETFSKGKTIVVFVMFFAFVFLGVMIGLFGPRVTSHQTLTVFQNTALFQQILRGERALTAEFGSVDRMNQRLWLTLTFVHYTEDKSLSTDLEFTNLQFAGRMKDSTEWKVIDDRQDYQLDLSCSEDAVDCDPIVIAYAPYVEYVDYRVTMRLKSNTWDVLEGEVGDMSITGYWINSSFTRFETAFRYTFLLFSLISFAYTYSKVRKYKQKVQPEQKWTVTLLIFLMMFNNPLFVCVFLVEGKFFSAVNLIFIVNFLAILLLYWLVSIHMLYTPRLRQTFARFYLPKFFIIFILWMSVLAFMMYEAFYPLDEKKYKTVQNIPGYVAFRFIAILFAFIYVFYLLYGVFRAFGNAKDIALLRKRTMATFVLTLAVVLVVISGVVFSVYGGAQGESDGAIFMSFWTVSNVYVFFMAYVYLPTKRGVHKDFVATPGVTAAGVSGSNVEEDDGRREDDEDVMLEEQNEDMVDDQLASASGSTRSGGVAGGDASDRRPAASADNGEADVEQGMADDDNDNNNTEDRQPRSVSI